MNEIEDYDALLAAMYDNEPTEEPVPEAPKVERPHGIMNMPLMSSKIRQLEATVEAQERLIKRMAQRLRKLELHAASQARRGDSEGH